MHNQGKICVHIEQQSKLEYKYLKPSQSTTTFFGTRVFDLRFDQLKDTMVDKGFMNAAWTFATYKFSHPNQKVNNPTTQEQLQELERELPMLIPNFIQQSKIAIKYTWIGHSTAVIQVGKDNLLIDPVFAQRCSPYQMMGPKRYRPPACRIDQLPLIDMVLVSHDHYDHLDEAALKELNDRYNSVFVSGLGSKSVFPKNANMIEMDWMEKKMIKINDEHYQIIFVPVCHWSRRGVNDYNTRLWGGFVIRTPYGQKIFYSGDTGYCGVFKEIGDKFGPFDLTILPIGAYEPRELLSPQHVNPEQAVIVHKQLKSKQSIGVHWGTFPLGRQGFYQAKYDLEQAKKKHNVGQKQFVAIKHGQSVIIDK